MMISNSRVLKNKNGAVAIYTAIVLAVLMGFAAFGVDVNYLYGVRNELQNAADAGALAGASVLFNSDGSLNPGAALTEGTRVANANKTGKQDVVVEIIETGHWSFADKEFTENSNTEQTDLEGRSFNDLDSDPNFINAVRVSTKRDDTPSFFAKILGVDDFFVRADAVAYIGFAGTLYATELDLPIAICEDSILDPDTNSYDCNMGRMLNSGGNPSTAMTAMWTDFSQDNPNDPDQNSCNTANAAEMKSITKGCSPNMKTVAYGLGIGTVNGVQDVVLSYVVDCWMANADSDGDGVPDQLWSVMLPVIDCDVDNTCSPLVGAVEVNIVWIHYKNDPWTQMKEVPTVMDDWDCLTTETLADRQDCWKDFVDHFQLENVNGDPLTDAEYEEMYQKKNIFFLPSCEGQPPAGGTEGPNFGVLAKIPKLVE